jgi:exodeoxyribonuclease VII small subunit
MARKKTTDGGEELAGPTFEEALAGLETIVEAMEHEHLPLEDLVGHYEKGSAYLARCEAILKAARGRIELITLRTRNEIALDADAKSFEGGELSPTDETDDDNDIRLF